MDPLTVVKKFQTDYDIEIAGLFAALLSYGRVEQIIKSLDNLFLRMDWQPYLFVKSNGYKSALKAFAGFKHRFNNEIDMALLSVAMQKVLKKYSSIENGFMDSLDKNANSPLQSAINSFRDKIMNYAAKESGLQKLPTSFNWLVPSASKGTCKRLCMYLRWMARPKDCIDFGIWKKLSPSLLIIPVDTHIEKMGKKLGLTSRKQGDWLMAEEITSALKKLDPVDPIKYDFALCSAGKMEFRGR